MVNKVMKKSLSVVLAVVMIFTTLITSNLTSIKAFAKDDSYVGVREFYKAQVWLNENYTGKPGYKPVEENGRTGSKLMKALVTALQIELGISGANGYFGKQTTSKTPTLRYGNENIYVKILQHGLYCKGYNPTGTTGYFGKNTKKAVQKLQSDAGFEASGIVTPMFFKAILNSDALVLIHGGDSKIRSMQQTLNRKYNAYFGIQPCDGIYSANTNKALIYALQSEIGYSTANAAPHFGPGTTKKCPTLKKGDTREAFVYILQYALYVNGYDPGDFDGIYDTQVEKAVKEFQKFMCYPDVTGIADMRVIKGLLASCGDTTRPGTACDCVTRITYDKAKTLKDNGYKYVGRYLTKIPNGLDKNLLPEEIDVILNSGLRFFPIFQTYSFRIDRFTEEQGNSDAKEAFYAATNLGIPYGSTIYFSVDGDTYDYQVKTNIMEYFKGVNERMQALGNKYKIGVYGTRNTCTKVSNKGYAVTSFVSDMSTGFSGNLGCKMPYNWAFDQIKEYKIGTGSGAIYIDKDVASGRDKGVGHIEYHAPTDYSKLEKVSNTFCADPIDLSLGAHVIDTELMSLNGGQNLSLDLTYNGAFLSNGLTGIGWTTNYSKKLEINEAGIKVFADDNSFSTFKNSEETNKYVTDAKGKKGYILTKNNNGSYELNCNNNQKEYYDKTGKLVKIEDKNNRVITLKHTDSTIKIIDSLTGKYLLLTKNLDGKIVSVKDSADRTVTLTYQKDCLVSITDVNNKKVSYTYDEKGRILTGTDSDGVCFFTNTYDGKGRITSQKDAIENSKKTLFSYDDTLVNGELLVTVIDRNGNQKTCLFDKNNLLIKMIDANENTTKYQYDDKGNLTKEIDSLGNEIVKTYSDTNKVLTEKDKLGNTTTYTYDKKDNLTKITYPDGTNKSFTYNEDNLLTSLIDIRGIETKYLYDDNNFLIEENKGGRKTRLSYVDGMLVTKTNALGNNETYVYNKFGFAETVTDYIGNKIKYKYDNKGRVIETTNAKGDVVTNTYDSNGNITSSKDAKENITKYKYNGNMKVVSKVLSNGGEIKYQYDGEDRLIKTIDVKGNEFQNIYDSVGRITEKIDSEGSKTLFEYDSVGNIVKQVNPNGGVILSSYDANGNLISQTDANKNTIKYEYDKLSRLIKIINAEGGETVNTYNNVGDLVSVTDPLKYKIQNKYNEFGDLSSVTDAKGNITKYNYDVSGNLISIVDALGNKTNNQYDGNNRLIATTDAKGNKQTFTYDEVGNKIIETDAKGNTVSKTYDANGNVLTITDSKGVIQSNIQYDSMNLPTIQIDAVGNKTVNTYDLKSNLLSTKDSLNNNKEFGYDTLGRITSVTNQIGCKNLATYDAEGNLIEMEGPLGGKIKYTYDKSGRMTSESTPSNGTINYEYNSLNKKSKITNARGQAKELAYDKSGKVTAYKNNEGNASFTYDKNGNVLIKRDNQGTVTREYDELNRVTKYTNALSETIKYEYDEVGNVKKLIYPDNTAVKYDYDENNNLVKVTDWNGRVTSYTYDENDNVTSVSKPDGSITETKYDDAQRVISTVEKTKTGKIIVGYEYTYDALGRITCEKLLAENLQYDMVYDDISRVAKRTETNLLTKETKTESFSYDKAGNILNVNVNDDNIEYVYDENNRLISYNGKEISYDLDGNMISGFINQKDISLSYDSDNRLIKAGNNSYTYDAENIRIRNLCEDDETTYTYDTNNTLSQLLMTKDKDGNVTKYVYGIGLIGEESEGAFKTYHFDYRGSTTAITNENGIVTDTFEYDTYGKLTNRTGSNKTIFMYNGRDGVVTDSNGLLYMRVRYYSPDLKRFINADILKGDITNDEVLNKYAYVNGNPVSNIDPFGLFSIKSWITKNAKKILIGTSVIAVGTAITVATGGAVLPALIGGFKAAAISGGISAGLSVGATTINSVTSGDEFSTVVKKSAMSAVDGFTDGYMVGGIMAGISQAISGSFKIAATKYGVKTGRKGGMYITKNSKILSPDAKWQANNGGTLFKYGNKFRVDVGSKELLHMHWSGVDHFPAGIIGSGFGTGISSIFKGEKNEIKSRK